MMKILLSILSFVGIGIIGFRNLGKKGKRPVKTEKQLANDYFPVQSDSEKAKGHPIVGTA